MSSQCLCSALSWNKLAAASSYRKNSTQMLRINRHFSHLVTHGLEIDTRLYHIINRKYHPLGIFYVKLPRQTVCVYLVILTSNKSGTFVFSDSVPPQYRYDIIICRDQSSHLGASQYSSWTKLCFVFCHAVCMCVLSFLLIWIHS